ncbi:MAG: glycosyltransferase [Candidatus Pacearchaeota archaeon]|nr:glycosyltransferase [Candidatus Pacearchaeota archaeon]
MELITIVIYLSVYMGLISTSFYIMSFIAGEKKKKPLYTDEELSKVKVTVIIPAYNEEDSIEKTVKSVSKSNYPDFEIIVVDDGSKDRTFEIAKKLEGSKVRVFHKENGGKGTALNFGIKKATGKIIFTMDADTTVDRESMKRMVRFFKDKTVMSVTPAMVINNPRTIFQRIQYTEYALGLFLRKAFSSLRAIYIAPGAFSAYRKWFFDKYGGYDERNMTEDLEVGLRIQYNGYHTENCPEAPAYTNAPATFKELTMKRRRWYFGQVRNLWKYRKIISRKYGDLGAFVIPTAILSTLFAVMITLFLFLKILNEVKDSLLFFNSVNFDFVNAMSLNLYVIERFLFLFFTRPAVLFTLFFMCILGFYTYYASKKIGKPPLMLVNWLLFFLLFAVMYGFWWIFSLSYSLTRKTVKW